MNTHYLLLLCIFTPQLLIAAATSSTAKLYQINTTGSGSSSCAHSLSSTPRCTTCNQTKNTITLSCTHATCTDCQARHYADQALGGKHIEQRIICRTCSTFDSHHTLDSSIKASALAGAISARINRAPLQPQERIDAEKEPEKEKRRLVAMHQRTRIAGGAVGLCAAAYELSTATHPAIGCWHVIKTIGFDTALGCVAGNCLLACCQRCRAKPHQD